MKSNINTTFGELTALIFCVAGNAFFLGWLIAGGLHQATPDCIADIVFGLLIINVIIAIVVAE